MGDRSPKAKQRDQKQKSATKATDAARAQTKQDTYSNAKVPGQKSSR